MSNIESVLNETRVFPPPEAMAKQANVPGMAAYKAMCDEAARDFEGFWPGTRARTSSGRSPSRRRSTSPARPSTSGSTTVS